MTKVLFSLTNRVFSRSKRPVFSLLLDQTIQGGRLSHDDPRVNMILRGTTSRARMQAIFPGSGKYSSSILAYIGPGSLVIVQRPSRFGTIFYGAFAAKPPWPSFTRVHPGSKSRPGCNYKLAHLVEQPTRDPICCPCSLVDAIDLHLSSGFSVQLGGSGASFPRQASMWASF